MIRRIVVIEGVTGAGKSQLIRALSALNRDGNVRTAVIEEDTTLGTLLEDLNLAQWRASPRFPSYDAVLASISGLSADDSTTDVIVERFHLTAYALMVEWGPIDRYDRMLSALGAVHVLVDFPVELIEQRSILRPDRQEEGWAAAMDAAYGGRSATIAAVAASQAGRREGLLRSRLSYIHFDTRDQDWRRYANAVDSYAAIVA